MKYGPQEAKESVELIHRTVDGFAKKARGWASKAPNAALASGFKEVTRDVGGLVAPAHVDPKVWGIVLEKFVLKYALHAVLAAAYAHDPSRAGFEAWTHMLGVVQAYDGAHEKAWQPAHVALQKLKHTLLARDGHAKQLLNTYLLHLLEQDGAQLYNVLALHQSRKHVMEDRASAPNQGVVFHDLEVLFPGNPAVATIYFRRMKHYEARANKVKTLKERVEAGLGQEILVVGRDESTGFLLTVTPVLADLHLANKHRKGAQLQVRRMQNLLSQLQQARSNPAQREAALPFEYALKVYHRVKNSPEHETREQAHELHKYLLEAYVGHNVVPEGSVGLVLKNGTEVRRDTEKMERRIFASTKAQPSAVVGVFVQLVRKGSLEKPGTPTVCASFGDVETWLRKEQPGAAVWLFGERAALQQQEVVQKLATLCSWQQEYTQRVLFKHLARARLSFERATATIMAINPSWMLKYVPPPRKHRRTKRVADPGRQQALVRFLGQPAGTAPVERPVQKGECVHWLAWKNCVKAREQLKGVRVGRIDRDPVVVHARKRFEGLKEAFLTRYMHKDADGVPVCRSCGNLFHQQEFVDDGTVFDGAYMSNRFVDSDDVLLNQVVRKSLGENPDLLHSVNQHRELEMLDYLNRRMQDIMHLLGVKRFAQQQYMDYERMEHLVGLQMFLTSWGKDEDARKNLLADMQQRKRYLGCKASIWFPERMEDELFEDPQRGVYFTLVLTSLAASLVTLVTPGEVVKIPACGPVNAKHFKQHAVAFFRGVHLDVDGRLVSVLDENPVLAYLLYMLGACLQVSRVWLNKDIFASMLHKKRGRKSKDETWNGKQHKQIVMSLVHAIDAMLHPPPHAPHPKAADHYRRAQTKQWKTFADMSRQWAHLYKSIVYAQTPTRSEKATLNPKAVPKRRPVFTVPKTKGRPVKGRATAVVKVKPADRQTVQQSWSKLDVDPKRMGNWDRTFVYPGVDAGWLVVTPKTSKISYRAATSFAQHVQEAVVAQLQEHYGALVRLLGRPSVEEKLASIQAHLKFFSGAKIPDLPKRPSGSVLRLETVLNKGCRAALDESAFVLDAQQWMIQAHRTLVKALVTKQKAIKDTVVGAWLQDVHR